jgi:hypothetical protein
MDSLRRWSPLLLMFALLLLAASGRLDAGTALGIGLVLELGLFLIVLWQIIVVARRYRRNRAAGLDFEAALEDGLARIFPRRLARLAALEPRLWGSLFRWVFRRRPPAAHEFPYTKRTIMGAVTGALLRAGRVIRHRAADPLAGGTLDSAVHRPLLGHLDAGSLRRDEGASPPAG